MLNVNVCLRKTEQVWLVHTLSVMSWFKYRMYRIAECVAVLTFIQSHAGHLITGLICVSSQKWPMRSLLYCGSVGELLSASQMTPPGQDRTHPLSPTLEGDDE